MDTLRVVEAPEGVELGLKVAGPLVRSYEIGRAHV